MLKSQSLTRDANHIALQAYNQFQAQDGTTVPKKSPLTVSSTPIAIKPPTGATRVTFYAVGADCRVSDEATAADHYFVIKAATNVSFDCANETTFYVLRDAGVDVTLNFMFQTI